MIFFLIIGPQEEFSILRLSVQKINKLKKKQRQGRHFYLMRKRHACGLTHRRPFAHGKKPWQRSKQSHIGRSLRANRREVFTPHSSAGFFQHDAAEFLFLRPPSTPKTLTSFSAQRTVLWRPETHCIALRAAPVCFRTRTSLRHACVPAPQREPGAARLADSCSRAIAAFFFFFFRTNRIMQSVQNEGHYQRRATLWQQMTVQSAVWKLAARSPDLSRRGFVCKGVDGCGSGGGRPTSTANDSYRPEQLCFTNYSHEFSSESGDL